MAIFGCARLIMPSIRYRHYAECAMIYYSICERE